MGTTKYHTFSLDQLHHLKLNEGQIVKYQEIIEPYRNLASVFKSNEGGYYYIHPELVKNNNIKVCSHVNTTLPNVSHPYHRFQLLQELTFEFWID